MAVINEELDQFIESNTDKRIGDTPENTGQCVGVVEDWTDLLGLPHTWGNADDLYANADPRYFQKLENTPPFVPQAGDIAVFSSQFNGTVGHCGVCTGVGDEQSFEMFEQNDPIGSACHKANYKYDYIIGFLRPSINTGDDVLLNDIQAVVNGSGDPQTKIQQIRQILAQ